MTEDEAKAKWCPFTRTAKYESGHAPMAINRPMTDEYWPKSLNCIASACMAWRWIGQWDRDLNQATATSSGYCGLAGVLQVKNN